MDNIFKIISNNKYKVDIEPSKKSIKYNYIRIKKYEILLKYIKNSFNEDEKKILYKIKKVINFIDNIDLMDKKEYDSKYKSIDNDIVCIDYYMKDNNIDKWIIYINDSNIDSFVEELYKIYINNEYRLSYKKIFKKYYKSFNIFINRLIKIITLNKKKYNLSEYDIKIDFSSVYSLLFFIDDKYRYEMGFIKKNYKTIYDIIIKVNPLYNFIHNT